MKENTNNKSRFYLKQTLSPILYLPFFVSLSIPMSLFIAIKTHSWDTFWKLMLITLFFYMLCYVFARYVRQYKIFWDDDAVGMRTTGGKEDIIISVNKITLIRQEASLERGRVFRRIAIYSQKPSGTGQFVDVSLKHFIPEDIKKLMNLIHEKRPDLEMPKGWLE